MTQTWIQKAFRPLKTYLPGWISSPIRNLATALLTPILFSWRSGHFRSSFKMAAVSKTGDPLPWYTYPCIDFLRFRSYEDKTVLEFGAGQSTRWWAQKAKRVIAFEGDEAWHQKVKASVPTNVELHLVPMDSPSACLGAIHRILRSQSDPRFDVVVIDGLWRYELIEIAARVVTDMGIIICDNAESYGIYEGFKDRNFHRVDFFGNAPGVVLSHCTSIFFRSDSFVFDPQNAIPVIAKES
jgi:hypothetical protein